MENWDTGRIYSVPQNIRDNQSYLQDGILSLANAKLETIAFIKNFTRDSVSVYRDALIQNFHNQQYFLQIDLQDLKAERDKLHDAVVKQPAEYLPQMESGAREALLSFGLDILDPELVPTIQISLIGNLGETNIRDIDAKDINRLVSVPGIVISATRTRPKASLIVVKCKRCGNVRRIPVPVGLTTAPIPRICTGQNQADPNNSGRNVVTSAENESCGTDSFYIVSDHCRYVDHQTIKFQEMIEHVPAGEMPRTILATADRIFADKLAPGTRVRLIGVVSVFNSSDGNAKRASGAATVRTPYLRIIGALTQDSEVAQGGRVATTTFLPEEEAAARKLASMPNIYERLSASIAPAISGEYTEDIKKAILCLLLGGRRKLLPDGARLRGDINVLLLGDPSTAKSQFLKFVERVAPVGVYTSGKGSSAAGLTASVLRDSRGEFYLEGGAMVLADGGVVCIDEFDKMRTEDRVAIHEAMEQQTISVAKAGITTILNSRCSVLAAANPIFGRYDDSRSTADNIDLLPTILSRFDLIFIVRDTRDEARDKKIAEHVISIHVNATDSLTDNTGLLEGESTVLRDSLTSNPESGDDISLSLMKTYISYARAKCAPTLSAEAAELLAVQWADIRKQSQELAEIGKREDSKQQDSAIPITVRQLEALVRVSEAVAKASLSVTVEPHHVREAIRLFTSSTMTAARSGVNVSESLSPLMHSRVKLVETIILRAIPLDGTVPTARMRERLLAAGYTETEVSLAFRFLEMRGEVSFRNERRMIKKLKESQPLGAR